MKKINFIIYMILFTICNLQSQTEKYNSYYLTEFGGHSILGFGYLSTQLYDLSEINSHLNLQTTLGGTPTSSHEIRRSTISINFNVCISKTNIFITTKFGGKYQYYKFDPDGNKDLQVSSSFYPLIDLEVSYLTNDLIFKVYYPILNDKSAFSFPGLNVGFRL